LDCLVVLTVSEIFEVHDFSLNFLSLLGRVSAHQALTDTSTEPHSHQITKNIETNTKTPKTTAFPPKTKHPGQISKELNQNPVFACSFLKNSCKIAISQRI